MTLKRTPNFEWAEYFKASAEKGRLHPLFEQLQPYLSPGLAVLDLGCGVGYGTIHLLEQGLEVTAVDIHEEAFLGKEQLKASKDCEGKPWVVTTTIADKYCARHP